MEKTMQHAMENDVECDILLGVMVMNISHVIHRHGFMLGIIVISGTIRNHRGDLCVPS